MFSDEDLLPISALQHLVFCERQCALICLEQVWAENRLTVEGRQLHDRAHSAGDERRGRVWIVRGLPLRSLALGLVGKADVVEFAPPEGRTPPHLPVARLFAHFRQLGAQKWRVTPVEYKRGRPKIHPCDRVQLCAQALCLEEMLGVAIPAGVLFYGRTRRRLDVAFDSTLRSLVESSARRLHELIAAGRTPPAAHEAKCDACSLRELCLPKAMAGRTNAAAFVAQQFDRHLVSPGPQGDFAPGPDAPD